MLKHLRDRHALRAVDAGVPAEQIRDEAGHREVGGVFGTEQLDAHEGAGEGGVARCREDGDEAQACKQIRWRPEEPAQDVAQRGTDKEQRSHFSAFET